MFHCHIHNSPQIIPFLNHVCTVYRGADKSLARPGRKQTRKHDRDARDFNNIETRAVINFLFLQGKAPKEIHAILTETLACFLPGRAKDLSAPCTTYSYILRSILVSSHRYLGLPSDLFPSGLPTKTLYAPLPTPYAPQAPPISFYLISPSEPSANENPFSFRQGSDAFSLNLSQVHSCVSPSVCLSGLTRYPSNLPTSTTFLPPRQNDLRTAVLPSAPAVLL